MRRPPATLLVVYECPIHRSRRLVIEMADSGSGTRVVGSKCCAGQYGTRLHVFTPTDKEWEALAFEAQEAL